MISFLVSFSFFKVVLRLLNYSLSKYVKKSLSLAEMSLVRCQEVALLVLRRVGLCVGQNQMCSRKLSGCGRLKLFLKKCGGEKNKKHWVGWSVGLTVVELKYGLYVFHLSKWFVFVLMFSF